MDKITYLLLIVKSKQNRRFSSTFLDFFDNLASESKGLSKRNHNNFDHSCLSFGWLVGRSVCWSVSLSVYHNFLKGRHVKLHFHASIEVLVYVLGSNNDLHLVLFDSVSSLGCQQQQVLTLIIP